MTNIEMSYSYVVYMYMYHCLVNCLCTLSNVPKEYESSIKIMQGLDFWHKSHISLHYGDWVLIQEKKNTIFFLNNISQNAS